jgi:hypothetical protein
MNSYVYMETTYAVQDEDSRTVTIVDTTSTDSGPYNVNAITIGFRLEKIGLSQLMSGRGY